MIIIGIDTSCDDTSVAVIKYCETTKKFHIKSNVISSQIKAHSVYGGVVPEIASREHLKNIHSVFGMAVEKSGIDISDVDLVAVTAGPGLLGSLIVGYSFARGLCLSRKIPLITVDHIKAHTAANFIDPFSIAFPAVALTISGGHSSLSLLESPVSAKFVGGTIDDAVGELFDKVARYLKLPYPGGPLIDKMSREGANKYKFPRPLMASQDYNFSFSGLKTAVINFTKQHPDFAMADLAHSMTVAICDVFIKKIDMAVREMSAKTVMLSGGVACNSMIREAVGRYCDENRLAVLLPEPILCTDNGVMIAVMGALNYLYTPAKNTENTDVYPTTRW